MTVKDKKISVWKIETQKINGVTKSTYTLAIESKIWAYYRETGGNRTLDSVNGLVLNNTIEDCIFIINYREDIKTENLIQFNGKVYTIQHINNGEGYRKDLILSCKLGKSLSYYDGMTLI